MRLLLIFLSLIFWNPAQSQSWGHSGKIAIVDGDAGHANAMSTVMARNLAKRLPVSRRPTITIIPTFFPDSAQMAEYSILSYSHIICCTEINRNNYVNHNQLTVAANGSNQHELISKSPYWPWVRAGTMDSVRRNKRTSYGPGIDFVNLTDTIVGYQDTRPYATAASESFATVLLVSDLYYIKYVRDSLCSCNEDWFQVYEAARRTASNYNQLYPSEGRTLTTGWGELNIEAAIGYSGSYNDNYWVLSDYQWGDTYNMSLTLIDSFPRRHALIGTELLKTYRSEFDGNVEYTVDAVKNYVLKNHLNGVFTATTDGSGDLLLTFPTMPDITYSLIAQNEGATAYILSTQPLTKAPGSAKIRVFGADGNPVTATSVTISYDIKDY